ncbi:MAG: tetratricopeptide repeat protein, partial [Moorea sp. SIO3C2]|nr:tetratricopeptide repeat protein [Moorena sp. SIO3C2]
MKKLSFLIAIALTCLLPSGKALSNSFVITPNSRFPTPDSRFPIPDSPLPIPHSRFPIPDSRFPIPDSLDQKAQQLYETGQYQEAIPLLDKIISNYRDSGDLIGEINALVNLALIYQRLGDWAQAEQTISQSFTQLSQLPLTKESQQLQGQILSVQGQVYLSLGQGEKALSTWQQTSAIYQELGDLTRLTESQIYQVQALRILGLYHQATKTLTQIKDSIQDQPDSALKSTALQYLGDVLRRVGKFKESQEILQQSLAIAENLPNQTLIAENLLSLGDTARLKGDTEEALDFYQRVVKESPLADITIQGQLNQLSVLIATQQWSRARALLPAIDYSLTTLSPSQRAIKARIKLAKTLLKSEKTQLKTPKALATYLADAIKLARKLGDKRAEAEAIGNLGTLYEYNQSFDEAQDLTEK